MALSVEGRGAYIVLEGGEGVGKSTQAAQLAANIGAALTRETGGTSIGQRIRTILHDTDVADMANEAEVLLVAADRAQHIHEVVRPAIMRGRNVVSDRNWWSTVAYQGFGRELDIEQILTITRIATKECFEPDLVFEASTDDNRQEGQCTWCEHAQKACYESEDSYGHY